MYGCSGRWNLQPLIFYLHEPTCHRTIKGREGVQIINLSYTPYCIYWKIFLGKGSANFLSVSCLFSPLLPPSTSRFSFPQLSSLAPDAVYKYHMWKLIWTGEPPLQMLHDVIDLYRGAPLQISHASINLYSPPCTNTHVVIDLFRGGGGCTNQPGINQHVQGTPLYRYSLW